MKKHKMLDAFHAGSMILSLLVLGVSPVAAQEEPIDPAEIVVGERLFVETRFAQFFAANAGGDANFVFAPGQGDPVLSAVTDPLNLLGEEITEGPFIDQSMNCRSCHFVDDLLSGDPETEAGPFTGMRTYADYARRSPIPIREDGLTTTARNSPPLVGSFQFSVNHFDGEFRSLSELVESTLSGRNYGWLASESSQAIAHVAQIVRGDDGTGELAQEFGGLPYSVVLTGTDPGIPIDFVLPQALRVDVATASDEKLFRAVAALIAAYTENLALSTDEAGAFNLSPYDSFLELNGLDRLPAKDETPSTYSRRLLNEVEERHMADALAFVRPAQYGPFLFHEQKFRFGPTHLAGMLVFFRQPEGAETGDYGSKDTLTGVGNCVACHQAPNFTDLSFHNTGVTQLEYDRLHGKGSFEALKIPRLNNRNNHPNKFLPATPAHPDASERFRRPASADPEHADLGMWNVFANPDFPAPQEALAEILCRQNGAASQSEAAAAGCKPKALLQRSIASFKTSGLRDLGHSAPYFHNGERNNLRQAVRLYRRAARLQRNGRLRNGAPALGGIFLSSDDVAPLAKFLRSLNEDYE